jgi:hypothetical protein
MKKMLLALALSCATLTPCLAQGVTRICAQSIGANGSNNCVDVIPGQLPPGIAITGNGAGTTGAVVATLAASPTKLTYICDFDVSAIGGTASVGPITVAGLAGGSKVYQLSSSATGTYLSKNFTPCLPSSAVNTAITITTTAAAGATAVDVNSSGFQQ